MDFAAIGDLYYLAGRMEKSLAAFQDAVRCPGGLGNPFLRLRIGECQFGLGHEVIAADELVRAYMGGGREIFANDPSITPLSYRNYDLVVAGGHGRQAGEDLAQVVVRVVPRRW